MIDPDVIEPAVIDPDVIDPPGPRTAQTDVRVLLGMTTGAAWALAGLFLVSKTIQMIMVSGDVHPRWPSVLLLLVVALCGLALLAAPGDRLPWPITAAMVVTVPILLYMVFTTTPSPTTAPQQTWPLATVAAICIYLSIRGRTAAAWILMIGCTVACSVWTTSTGQGIGEAGKLMATTVAGLAAATLFSLTIRPAVDNIYELRNRSVQTNAAQAAALAVLEENREQMRYLDAEVRPTLNRIARPEALTDVERAHCRRLEESLRDRVRAPVIAADAGASAAAARARARGVEGVMVDGHALDEVTAERRTAVLAGLAGALDSAVSGSVVVRVLPPGRQLLATVVIDPATEGGDPVRLEFGTGGGPDDDPAPPPVSI